MGRSIDSTTLAGYNKCWNVNPFIITEEVSININNKSSLLGVKSVVSLLVIYSSVLSEFDSNDSYGFVWFLCHNVAFELFGLEVNILYYTPAI